MKHDQITPGMTLKLKPARQAAYGFASPLVTVTALKPRPGYVVPWVQSEQGFFTPSDFAEVSQ